jgi:hypothetical protein
MAISLKQLRASSETHHARKYGPGYLAVRFGFDEGRAAAKTREFVSSFEIKAFRRHEPVVPTIYHVRV